MHLLGARRRRDSRQSTSHRPRALEKNTCRCARLGVADLGSRPILSYTFATRISYTGWVLLRSNPSSRALLRPPHLGALPGPRRPAAPVRDPPSHAAVSSPHRPELFPVRAEPRLRGSATLAEACAIVPTPHTPSAHVTPRERPGPPQHPQRDDDERAGRRRARRDAADKHRLDARVRPRRDARVRRPAPHPRGRRGVDLAHESRRALAERLREGIVREEEGEARHRARDERPRVAEKGDAEREHQGAEVVGAVVVRVALEPAQELRLGLGRREFGEELRQRARARVPVHLAERVHELARGDVRPIHPPRSRPAGA